jgi:hypothetical protein
MKVVTGYLGHRCRRESTKKDLPIIPECVKVDRAQPRPCSVTATFAVRGKNSWTQKKRVTESGTLLQVLAAIQPIHVCNSKRHSAYRNGLDAAT